jgi:hypothetical protein
MVARKKLHKATKLRNPVMQVNNLSETNAAKTGKTLVDAKVDELYGKQAMNHNQK